MKVLQKIIAPIMLISLILSLSLGLLFWGPKQAKGQIGVPVQDAPTEIQEIMATLKEWGLDQVVRSIARMAMNRLRASIIRWAQGGFRDDNQPLAITNWKGFFKQAIDIASARFIQEFGLTPLCSPIRVSLNTLLGLNLRQGGVILYEEYAACTIDQIVDNVEEFWKNPSIQVYGWDTWTALMQPQNNIFGSALMALQRESDIQDEELNAAQQEAQAGQGYQDETICNETDREACEKRCSEAGPPSLDCLKNCELSTLGVCLNETTKNIGSTVNAAIEKTVGSDIDWLISADEWSELIEIMISSLLNKAIFGLGLSGGTYRTTTQQQYQEQNAYHQITKQMLTPQNQYQVKSKTLSRILGAIQSINRSVRTCETSEAIDINVLVRAYDDVLEGESEALYSETERINLQPDYEILDPINAPSDLMVYGYSWENIPAYKYPSQCRKLLTDSGITGKCQKFNSGLPPVSTDSNCECIFGINHHNCPPAPYPPLSLTSALDKAKANFYNSCKGIYNNVVNRCDACLKEAGEKCEKISDAAKRLQCIDNACNNYTGIAGVTGAQDFYNKCLIEERKTACYTCLKEYFMPANYCGQIGDYIARATVKYPGTYRKSESTLGIDWLNADSVAWIGVKDSSVCPDSATDGAETGVDLICRIVPDFAFGDGRTCQANCPFTASFTKEMLYDINDNSPNENDCNQRSVRTGGSPGIWAVENGAFENKGKCCRAFKGHKPDDYAACGRTPVDKCGNGVVESGEDCDGGPCCKSDCTPRRSSYATDECDSRTQDGCCDGKGYCTFDCDGGGGGGGGCTDDSDCSNGRICNDNGRCVIDRGR